MNPMMDPGTNMWVGVMKIQGEGKGVKLDVGKQINELKRTCLRRQLAWESECHLAEEGEWLKNTG